MKTNNTKEIALNLIYIYKIFGAHVMDGDSDDGREFVKFIIVNKIWGVIKIVHDKPRHRRSGSIERANGKIEEILTIKRSCFVVQQGSTGIQYDEI